MADRIELRMSPNLVRFAGVAEYLETSVQNYGRAWSSANDKVASSDLTRGLCYIDDFDESLSDEEKEKYSPLIGALREQFFKEIKVFS